MYSICNLRMGVRTQDYKHDPQWSLTTVTSSSAATACRPRLRASRDSYTMVCQVRFPMCHRMFSDLQWFTGCALQCVTGYFSAFTVLQRLALVWRVRTSHIHKNSCVCGRTLSRSIGFFFSSSLPSKGNLIKRAASPARLFVRLSIHGLPEGLYLRKVQTCAQYFLKMRPVKFNLAHKVAEPRHVIAIAANRLLQRPLRSLRYP